MPYVVLLYSGAFPMLVFELTASVRALRLVIPGINARICAGITGAAAFALSVSRWTEREMASAVSGWYYPLIGAPVCLIGLLAWIRMKKKMQKGGPA